MERHYYEAYDDRYRQVHSRNLEWGSRVPTPILGQILASLGIRKEDSILELGCGEGRDARPLLEKGYHLTAVDISPEAIAFCRKADPLHANAYRTADCVRGELDGTFDFIYAIAVVHMLVADSDRDGFYTFLRTHLKPGGAALICSMGDGETEYASDPSAAFTLQERTHGATGEHMQIAGTTCRMVSMPNFQKEIRRNGLEPITCGMTSAEPDFSSMLYALVK